MSQISGQAGKWHEGKRAEPGCPEAKLTNTREISKISRQDNRSVTDDAKNGKSKITYRLIWQGLCSTV